MEWKTKITDLLGCRYPILQGAMERLGDWKFAANVAETGAHGTITASISKTPQQLREDIKKCRQATRGSFGVNLSIGLCPQLDEMLDVCIEERVPIETSVYKPDALAQRIKQSGLPWIHKSARIKDAVHAQEQGAGAIILVGLEGAGIKNPEQLPTMTTILWGRRRLTVPLIAAGGIGDAHGFLGALALGAEGIMMGSAFLATRESPIDNLSKERITTLTPDDPELRKRVMTTERFKKGEEAPAGPKEIDWSQAISFTAGVINQVPTMQELVDAIVNGAEAILKERPFSCYTKRD
jgi:NADH:quinone reductase (non-electrogenic)